MAHLYDTEWEEMSKKYPNYIAWHSRLTARPVIKKMIQEKAEAMAAASKQ